MSRTLTPNDGYVVMQDVVNQLMGVGQVAQINASNFASVGEQVATFGQEAVFNAINMSLGRMIIAVRPASESFNLIQAIDTKEFNSRFRKVSFYSKNTKPSGMFNTDLYTNHATGYTDGENGSADQVTGRTPSTKSMWEQNLAVPLELDFGGMTTWQYCITNLMIDGKYAFESENEWIRFLNGYLTQHANDLAMEREAFKRMTFLNHVGVDYTIGTTLTGTGMARNLTSEFNTKFNTNYTTAQLLTTYFDAFLAFFVSTVKKDVKRMKRHTILEHIFPAKTEGGTSLYLPRSTPASMQKLALLDSFWIDAEAYVMPKIFNTEYLDIGNFESIEYWQNPTAPAEVSVKVPIPGWVNKLLTSGSSTSDTTSEVSISYLLGALFDTDACLVDMKVDKALTTPIEARKGYSNTWITFVKNAISDPTEKTIIYYMADPASSDDSGSDDSGSDDSGNDSTTVTP